VYEPVPPAGKTEYVTVSPIVGVVFETIHFAVIDWACAGVGNITTDPMIAREYTSVNR
jgi:hypothetical protein